MAEFKFEQTKNHIVLTGIIAGKDNPKKSNGYKEGVIENGDYKGNKYRSIRFMLKTSDSNVIPVEVFGTTKENVVFYNEKLKKSVKVNWEQRHTAKYDGYELMLPEYDLAEIINNEFKDGDSVTIKGKIRYQIYEDKLQIKFIIGKIYKCTEPLDFTSENFKEKCYFNQEIIVESVEEDKKENKVFVNAYHIEYGDRINFCSFEVDPLHVTPTFIKNIKGLKFGDFIKVSGVIHSRVIYTEVNGDWGRDVIKENKKCLEIDKCYQETFVAKKYIKKDFENEPAEELPFNL